MGLLFEKYEGLGNDFVVVTAEREDAVSADEARAICDRRFGVGADGVLLVLPPRIEGAAARMRVVNADGSVPEMCGNGLRCVVKFLWERDPALRKDALTIDTGTGPLRCTIAADGAITVDMGKPRLTRAEIPMTGPAGERALEQRLELAGESLEITGVNMGNPHAVVFVRAPDDVARLARSVGPSMETHAWFPRKTNAEFVFARGPRELDFAVWERGVGLTLACGTGACAAVVAACLTGRATQGDEVTVHLPGGDLAITYAADGSTVFMRGPALHVFDGELDVAAVLRATRPTR